jgi:hypothetical protein
VLGFGAVYTNEERQEEKEQASFEGKGGAQNVMLHPLMAERSWVGRASVLRRGPQKKAFGAPAVAVNEGS